MVRKLSVRHTFSEPIAFSLSPKAITWEIVGGSTFENHHNLAKYSVNYKISVISISKGSILKIMKLIWGLISLIKLQIEVLGVKVNVVLRNIVRESIKCIWDVN